MVSGKVLLLASAAVLLPSIAGQVMAQTVETAARPFAPPESPLVLTRTVWRTLGDGKEIVVRRRYAIRFTRQVDGFLLDGHLLDAAVEAPPMLAAMADIERNRGDQGLFPIRLDAAGQIRDGTGAQQRPTLPRYEARDRAQDVLAGSTLAKARRHETGSFLSHLASQGALAAWPADLFNPATGERREHRLIALPGGQEGEVDVSIRVVDPQANGLPRAVERTVTTVMAGTARTSREQWTLAPAELNSP